MARHAGGESAARIGKTRGARDRAPIPWRRTIVGWLFASAPRHHRPVYGQESDTRCYRYDPLPFIERRGRFGSTGCRGGRRSGGTTSCQPQRGWNRAASHPRSGTGPTWHSSRSGEGAEIRGKLVVLGFNPLSLWLFSKPLAAFRDLRPLSVPRLHDWLTVLGLEREARTVYLNYRSVLPIVDRWQTATWLNGVHLPFGGVYIFVARKHGHGVILQPRRQRRTDRELASLAVPTPTRRAHAAP